MARWIKDGINDDDFIDMFHTTHVIQKTSYNESVAFEEFYKFVSKFAFR